MPLSLRSLLSVHSPIALHCALVSVWPTSNSASAQRGPVGPRKEATRAACASCSTEASVSQSVSSQYHSVTAPAGHSSSSKSQNCLSIHPPRAHMLEVRLGRGPVPILASDQTPRIHYLLLTLFFSRLLLPKQGARASWRESAVEYCKHMCVTCEMDRELNTFFPPLAWHFTLQKMQTV